MAKGMVCALLAAVLAVPVLASAQTDEEIEEAIRIFNRGKSLHQQLRYQDAVREYRAALRLDPENPFVYNAQGLALAALGSFKDAIKSFERALSINPDLVDVYNNIGMVHAESGDREKAFEAFSRAARNPNYLTPEKSLYNMGNLYFDSGQVDMAITYYRRAVTEKPEFALGYRGLGKAYLALNDVEGAEAEFAKAVELFDSDIESLFQLARINQERGDAEEARRLYRRVLEIDRMSSFGQLAQQQLDGLKRGS